MNQQQVTTAPQGPKAVIEQFRRDLEKMGPQFSYALPAHIPLERFNRVVMTALQNSPALLKCTRHSIFNACMKAASDGLLPDNREGALVPFGESEDGRKTSDQATWMPMVAGIRKKARNSGELSDLYAHVVHEGDAFEYQLGDDPHIHHRPSLRGGRTRKIIAAYSIAVFKDGTKAYEIMSIEEIEDVRKRYSKSKKGPWNDPIAYPEMCRKTVVRLHCKSLPMSTDLDDVIRRDDDLYDLKGAAERGNEITRRQPRNAMAALDQFAPSGGNGNGNGHAPTGADDVASPPADNYLGDPQPGDGTVIEGHLQPGDGTGKPEPSAVDAIAVLIDKAGKHPPRNVEEFRLLVSGLVDLAATGEVDAIEKIKIWWASAAGRSLRNKAMLTGEDTAAIAAEIKAAIEGPAGAQAS